MWLFFFYLTTCGGQCLKAKLKQNFDVIDLPYPAVYKVVNNNLTSTNYNMCASLVEIKLHDIVNVILYWASLHH